jgi:hypothetical protein
MMSRKARKRSMAARQAAMTRRLVRLAADVAPADWTAGAAWYDRAAASADGMAEAYDVSREVAAGVIAHLSPRESWARNVANAARMLDAAHRGAACPAVAVGRQRVKAWRVARGQANPFASHGPKTLAFTRCILGDREAVCVDSWAARAATGDPRHEGPRTALQYRTMAAAYRSAARILGVDPRTLQAALWIHVRGAAD